MDQGKIGHPSRGKQTFAEYVKNIWLPNHQVEPSTMQSYTYTLNRHILPTFGPMRMVDILPEHVRAWIAKLKEDGVKAPTIKYAKVLLSVIFTTALNDQVTYIHPGRGVRTPTVAVKPRTVITPEQFDVLYQALPDSDTQLLVETAIETGLRWGELSELRVKDLNTRTRILTVSRAVVEVNPKFHPDGGRFIAKEYPKDKEFRRFKLSRQMVDKLEEHIRSEGLERDDLFFTWKHVPQARSRTKALLDVDTLGWTKPNENGKTYKHGTLSAYNAGKCRCEYCRAAFAQYRAKRRGEEGKDTPRQPRQRDTDGHIPADWFRRQVWKPALKEADLGIHVRMLSRPGARYWCCHQPVSPDRSPNPPYRSLGNGLSTASAVRRGSWWAMGMGSCCPGRCNGRPSPSRSGRTRSRPLRCATARWRRSVGGGVDPNSRPGVTSRSRFPWCRRSGSSTICTRWPAGVVRCIARLGRKGCRRPRSALG
ncbi:tyrosine-type recombinase/integrase [Microbispora sp. NBC_01389]|uniref:tyrosine-type recombinase/integrase n=1 Tax=Microbispora sp. NBC_01389 TaxID=2903584 RepID=UPI003253A8F2